MASSMPSSSLLHLQMKECDPKHTMVVLEGEREERERVRSICMCMWDNEWLCQSMHVSVGKKEVGLMR